MRYKIRDESCLEGVECEIVSTFITSPLSIRHYPKCWGRFYVVKTLEDSRKAYGKVIYPKGSKHTIHNLDLQMIDMIDEYIINHNGKL